MVASMIQPHFPASNPSNPPQIIAMPAQRRKASTQKLPKAPAGNQKPSGSKSQPAKSTRNNVSTPQTEKASNNGTRDELGATFSAHNDRRKRQLRDSSNALSDNEAMSPLSSPPVVGVSIVMDEAC